MSVIRIILIAAFSFLVVATASAQKRKIIIDQDGAGPAGTDQQSMLLLIQSPHTEVLGITMVTGDQWLKAELAHTLRMLELIGRTDIPVMAGAEYPLVRTKEQSELDEQQYGRFAWLGAWTPRFYHPAGDLGPMPEGSPMTKPASEDAIHFLIRMVHQYPNEVSLYEGGPMTNLALAIAIDPDFPRLAKELIFMGASLAPQTNDPEFVNTPRREFNLWFDPEAAHMVLRAPWKKIVCTTVDISVKTDFSAALLDKIKAAHSPAAQYVAKFSRRRGQYDYLWDELAAAAWLDPSTITKTETRLMDVDIAHGPNYGNTLTWSEQDKPTVQLQPVQIQVDLDTARFDDMFINLLTSSPSARH